VNEFHIVSREERLEEANEVSKYFGFHYLIADLEVNRYDFKSVLDSVQDTINIFQPREIYIPHPSYNQDHQTAFKACFTALRLHDKNYFVKRVLVYEQIHPNLWDTEGFQPNYFRELDMEKKIKGYLLHQSQVRMHRSLAKIKMLAQWRGAQSDMLFAEGFKILRWID
jgi:LmbE family N-acetylglucosaminyl deacetylase